MRVRVMRSPFRFYDVKVGDIGHVLEVRYRGQSIEAWYLRMERTGEEHWFRAYDLEVVIDAR